MSVSLLALSVIGLLIAGSAGVLAAEADWKPAPAPLMTRWAKDVSPDKARPEYPRPNAVRKEWQNLNGLWEFAFDDANKGRAAGWQSGQALSEKILVPWTFEAALSGIGKGKEIHERVWYRRAFAIPRKWNGKRVLLHFGAVDWESVVWVNGKEMGTHRGGYAPFSYDITDALKAEGPQEVVVAVYDPADPKKGAYQPKGKQLGSEGIWYTRTTGIWQTVWLEPVNRSHITQVILEPTLSPNGTSGRLQGQIVAVGEPEDYEVEVALLQDGVEVRSTRWAISKEEIRLLSPASKADMQPERDIRYVNLMPSGIYLDVDSPALWTPESPNLYDVKITLKLGKRILDEVKSYCAFRSVGMENGRITLNGKPYFLKGVLDQGFWPDGIYTPPTDAAIKNEVVMTKAFGFNLARKHVKVEDARWYYWCDRLGLLVAQDMPSSHNLTTNEAKENFVHEWNEIMAAVRAHPAIILWIPFNENWGDPKEFQDHVVDLTRAADSSRPIIDASGWTQRDKTDITDIHDYGNDLKKHCLANPPRPRWIGEYGGVALPIEGHTWITGWGYQTVKTPKQLLEKYRFLTDQVNGGLGLSGFVYTQLTDVEQELNGVMTYDRQPKAPAKKIAAINAGNPSVTTPK